MGCISLNTGILRVFFGTPESTSTQGGAIRYIKIFHFALDPSVFAAFRWGLGLAATSVHINSSSPKQLDARAEERDGRWSMGLGNAYTYASKSEDAAFLLVFGNIFARSAGVLVS